MKMIQVTIVVASLLCVVGCTTQPKVAAEHNHRAALAKQRPMLAVLPAKYQALFTTWMNQDCRVDSANIALDIASGGLIVEDAMWEAYNLGPTAEARADLQNSLRARYALRQRWLMQNGAEVLKPPLSAQLLAESEEEFGATEMTKLNKRWRDGTLSGLGLVCTSRSLERLRLLAEDESGTTSIVVKEALRTSGDCASPAKDRGIRFQGG